MMRQDRIRRFVRVCQRFAGKRILVLGDLMVDQYVWGQVERISPEAPVPVVHVVSESLRLGGAANVAGNLRALGAKVLLAGVVGDDPVGQQFRKLAAESGIDGEGILTDPHRGTTVKTRIIAHSQQVVRLDREVVAPLSKKLRAGLVRLVADAAPRLDGIIISDYGKGVVTKGLMAAFRNALGRRAIPVAVDPQVPNIGLYRNLTLISPNHHEAGAALGRKLQTEADIRWAGETLLKKLRLRAVLITRGEKGMALFEAGGKVSLIPTVAREVYDVTGAGDTVIATLTLALAAGASMTDAAAISNFAAGTVVGEVGTVTIPVQRLIQVIRSAREADFRYR